MNPPRSVSVSRSIPPLHLCRCVFFCTLFLFFVGGVQVRVHKGPGSWTSLGCFWPGVRFFFSGPRPPLRLPHEHEAIRGNAPPFPSLSHSLYLDGCCVVFMLYCVVGVVRFFCSFVSQEICRILRGKVIGTPPSDVMFWMYLSTGHYLYYWQVFILLYFCFCVCVCCFVLCVVVVLRIRESCSG